MNRTDELIQLADAATPGPWRKTAHGVVLTNRGNGEIDDIVMWDDSPANVTHDAVYIAAANPQTVKQMALLVKQMVALLKMWEVCSKAESGISVCIKETGEALAAYEHFEQGEQK